MFQPLTQLEIVARHKEKGTMEYLQDARIIHHYSSLHTNVIKSTLVLFLSEILRSSIQEEEQNQPLYNFLESSLLWLDDQEKIANFQVYLQLYIYSLSGSEFDIKSRRKINCF